MKLWRTILVLLVVALTAALAWHWLAGDPGYVQLRIRGTTIETSVVVAIACVVFFFIALLFCWWLLNLPFRLWGHSRQRRGRERLAGGLTAFAEGDYAQAERELGKAANHEAYRTPALLALARSAHERGAPDRASLALGGVGPRGVRAADALRARIAMDHGRADEATALLRPKLASNQLSPRGLRVLIDAALASGDAQTAVDALPLLAKTGVLSADAQASLELRVLAAGLVEAPDETRLNALWSHATRAQRRRPELIAAFARRAAGLGMTLAAMDEIEAALRREWTDDLVTAYAELGPSELPARVHKAESWLALAPNSAALASTIGRLYVQQAQWSKAQAPLERALAISQTPIAWEALGDCRRGEGDTASAATCYSNALRCARGMATVPLGPRLARGDVDTRPVVIEERSEHGVPRLPAPR